MSEQRLNGLGESDRSAVESPGRAGGGAEGRPGRAGAEPPAPPPAPKSARPPLSGRGGPAGDRLATTETRFTPEQ